MKSLRETLKPLPEVWANDLLPEIRRANEASGKSIVVLDDDPTGTQTVHDVPVRTEWSVEALTDELDRGTPLFYILTNSRSLTAPKAEELAREIGRNLKLASAAAGREVVVISRSDSTLRGHYPMEVDALLEEMGQSESIHLIIPFFEEGGRLTIDNVHYVLEEDELVPAAETPFARDASFGFKKSDLREWIAEKTGGRVSAETVHCVSLNDLRQGGPEVVAGRLKSIPAKGVCVVNAVTMRDVEVFVSGLIKAEAHGGRFIGRTAASFVRARAGLTKQPLLGPADLPPPPATVNPGRLNGRIAGGLIVVGSHVPKTTAQLDRLLAEPEPTLRPAELSVGELMGGRRRAAIDEAVWRLNILLSRGSDAVLFTSRDLIAGTDAAASLEIGSKVSAALVEIVRRLELQPRFLIAKGGITSSDVATKGLGVKRAIVTGQILPGVPVWSLGEESRFPGMNYIVFPGNIGGTGALLAAYRKLSIGRRNDEHAL